MKVDVFYLVKLKLKTPSFLWQTFMVPIKTIPVFFQDFFQKLITFCAKNLIIGGDFNLVLNDTLDKIGGPKHKNAQARNSLISHMNILKLKDVFRFKYPLAKSFTRIQINPFTATRLDFFLVSENLCGKVIKTEIKASVKSDHKISTIAIDVAQDPRGPGFWKLNTKRCYDRNYVHYIKRCINEYIIINPEGDVNPHIRWDTLKCYLRGCTVAFSKNRMKQITSYRKNLQNLLQNTENLLLNAGDQHEKGCCQL